MGAGIYNYTIEQGFDFSRVFYWKNPDGTPINITGWTASSQITDDENNVLVDFSTNGGVIVNGTAGTVAIWLLGAFTAGLDFDTADHYIKLIGPSGSAPDGIAAAKDKLIKGIVSLDPQEPS